MSDKEVKKCSECSGEMTNEYHIGYFTDSTLRKGEQYPGEPINAWCCLSCGFIELYKEMRTKCPQCCTYYDRTMEKCPRCGCKKEGVKP